MKEKLQTNYTKSLHKSKLKRQTTKHSKQKLTEERTKQKK